ncbi:MAG: 3'-5' exonuclease, partial [Lentisphaerota bacterium]
PPEYKKKTFQFDWVQTTEDKGIAKSNVSVIEHTADRIVKALCDYKWETEAQGVGKTESLRPRDIAILVPENKHATQIQTALKRRGITAVISNSGNVFNSAMAKEVYFILRAIQNPENGKYLKTALGGKLFRFPEKLLADIAGNEESGSDNDTDRLAFWADRFKEYRAAWEKKGVMPMLSSLVMVENLHPARIREKGTAWTSGNPIKRGIENLAEPRPAVDGLDDRERNIVDMRHLMELLHRTESEQSLSSELLLAWLQRMLKNSIPKETDQEALQTRLETDQEAVTIMTIHKSKGLQFPLVFSPLLWNRNYELEPQNKDTDWFCHSFKENSSPGLVMPLGGKAKELHKHQGEMEALGELLRVAYVAATRAEHFCCLLYGNFSGDCTRTSLNYLLKKDLRGEGFFENNVMPVGNAPPQFNNIRVFPVEVEKLTYPENPEKYEHQETCTKKLKTCDLRNNFVVPKNWGIMSYSSLGKHKVSHAPLINVSGGTDEAKQTPEAVKTPEEESEKELSLPSNEKTGLCFHEIMEHLDFTLVNGDSHGKWSETPSIRELIENKMRKYGLIRGKRSTAGTEDPLLAERYPLICKTIHQTLSTRIPGTCAGNAFSFNEIEKKDRISEMEFFYEIKGAINRDKLKEIARELLQNTVMEEDNESEAD